VADREPRATDGRPNGDMTDPSGAERARFLRARHAAHDLVVIAAAADRDADDAARTAAEAQIADCEDCAVLFADLRTISENLTALPRTLPIARDFRISPERAAGLRPGGWRRFADGLRRRQSLRPLASALTTLGVAGLLLTVALPTVFSGLGAATGGAAPAALEAGSPAAASGTGADSAAGGAKSGPTTQPDRVGLVTGGAGSPGVPQSASTPPAAFNTTPSPAAGEGRTNDTVFGARETEPPSPLAIAAWISLVLLIAGLGLFVVARLGARDRAG
jgi:hypothetical protein